MDRSDFNWLVSLIWYVLFAVTHEGFALIFSMLFLALSIFSSWSAWRKKRKAVPNFSLTINFGTGEKAKKARNDLLNEFSAATKSEDVEVGK